MAARRGSCKGVDMDISLNGVTYKDAYLVKGEYGDGTLALMLEDEDGLIAVVSVWTGLTPEAGCIWVKNYGENAGIQEALVAAGALEMTGGWMAFGYVNMYEAKVLV